MDLQTGATDQSAILEANAMSRGRSACTQIYIVIRNVCVTGAYTSGQFPCK